MTQSITQRDRLSYPLAASRHQQRNKRVSMWERLNLLFCKPVHQATARKFYALNLALVEPVWSGSYRHEPDDKTGEDVEERLELIKN